MFARCPDCKQINAFTVFRKSFETLNKLILLLEESQIDAETKEIQYKSILSGIVSAFDGLGKGLKTSHPAIFPEKPKNLFQNLDELNKVLENQLGVKLSDDQETFEFLIKLFQARHVWEHNMGVIDESFVTKVPSLKHLKGRKYTLNKTELEQLLQALSQVVDAIQKKL